MYKIDMSSPSIDTVVSWHPIFHFGLVWKRLKASQYSIKCHSCFVWSLHGSLPPAFTVQIDPRCDWTWCVPYVLTSSPGYICAQCLEPWSEISGRGWMENTVAYLNLLHSIALQHQKARPAEWDNWQLRNYVWPLCTYLDWLAELTSLLQTETN